MVIFMPNPGEHLPTFPVPQEHDAFLGGLPHTELIELGEILSYKGGWRQIIVGEKITREQDIDGIRTYIPPAESPPYDPEAEPGDYIAQIRQLNRETPATYAQNSLKDEKRYVQALAAETVTRHHSALLESVGDVTRLTTEQLSDFFYSNLRGIALTSRMQGLAAFESEKYKTVRQHLPTVRINDKGIKGQIRNQAITGVQIKAAKQAVLALPHTTPSPDFFQMTKEQQEAIVTALSAEWIELCKITAHHDPHALGVKANRTGGPLAYHSVETLRQAIEQNPSIEPSKICRLFLKHPEQFEIKIKAARKDIEQREQPEVAHEKQPAQEKDSQPQPHIIEVVGESTSDEASSEIASNVTDESTPEEPLTGPITIIKNYPSTAGRLSDAVEIISDRGTQWFSRQTDRAFENLAELCSVLPADATYNLVEAWATLPQVWNPKDIEAKLRSITTGLPPGIVTMGEGVLKIGNITLIGRKTTADDVLREHSRIREVIDKDKTSIVTQDHARITVRNAHNDEEQSYYMPLDRANALLAARVMEFLEYKATRVAFVTGDDIASYAWAHMPTIERELFLTRQKDILGKSSAIKPPILDIARKLTNIMGITREITSECFKFRGIPTITLHEDAPEASEVQGFRPMFPAGTDRENIQKPVADPIPESALVTAKYLLEHQVGSTEPLTQDVAHKLLGLITDTDVKRAIRYQIKAMNLERTSASVLETLRDQAELSFGEGFASAWSQYMIFGNSILGRYRDRIRLTGGELSTTTNMASITTRKWFIGHPLA